MGGLIKLVANAPTFIIAYVLFMIPTYILPYLGSNSAAVNFTGAATGIGMSPGFWMHLVCLAVLCLLAWARATYVKQVWIVILPILALIFDLSPGLNLVPFVPTVLHILTIVFGVKYAPQHANRAAV